MGATILQIEYMQGLLDDLGFNRTQRNAFLSAVLGRDVRSLDALTKREASGIINDLKARQKEQRGW